MVVCVWISVEYLHWQLQEGEEIPRDWTTLFDDMLFKFDTSLIPEAISLYDKLNVKKSPLSLIPPQFETPLPPLQPAVFPPAIREPAPPALELFDLDENFASEQVGTPSLASQTHLTVASLCTVLLASFIAVWHPFSLFYASPLHESLHSC